MNSEILDIIICILLGIAIGIILHGFIELYFMEIAIKQLTNNTYHSNMVYIENFQLPRRE